VTPECLLRGEHEVWLGDALSQSSAELVMHGEQADLLCVDAPYSEKTHAGHAGGKLTADSAAAFAARHSAAPTRESRYAARKSAAGESGRRDIDYAAFSPDNVRWFVEVWAPRTRGWFVTITDDCLAPVWAAALEAHDRYVFAPLPLVETGSRVRMVGDGPSNWTCWIVVARPRTSKFAKWGTLPGAYVQPGERAMNSAQGTARVVGGKPLRSMCAIVGDYSRPGDLVVDPCCGAGTALVAARYLGRRARGLDAKPEHASLSVRALEKTREQRSLFAEGA